MKNQNKNIPDSGADKHSCSGHNIFQVCAGILSFYFIVILYDAKGIYYWSKKLPVNNWTSALSEIAYEHWRLVSKDGFEEPKHYLETQWLHFQEAHPLLFPKKFAAISLAKKERDAKRHHREELWKSDPNLKLQDQRQKEVYVSSEVSTPDAKLHRILMIGDSLMMTVGPVLKEAFESKLKSQVTLRAKLATGLARPDVFDWRQEIDQLAVSGKFEITVVLMGANDSQDFLDQNQVFTYGTPGWVRVYRNRVKEVMAKVCQYSNTALWIGLPPMQSNNFQRKAKRLNKWIERAAEDHHCIKFIDSSKIFGDDLGKYESYKNVDGKTEKIRTTDGIHITKRGAQLLLDPVLRALESPASASLAH